MRCNLNNKYQIARKAESIRHKAKCSMTRFKHKTLSKALLLQMSSELSDVVIKEVYENDKVD